MTHHFSRNYFFAVVRTSQWEAFTCFKMILQFLQLKQNNARLVNYFREVRYHFKQTVERLSMLSMLLLLTMMMMMMTEIRETLWLSNLKKNPDGYTPQHQLLSRL